MSASHDALRLFDEALPRGSRWRHWKGTEYTIVTLSVDEPTASLCVVYADGAGNTWHRSIFAFRGFVDGDRSKPRFVRVP